MHALWFAAIIMVCLNHSCVQTFNAHTSCADGWIRHSKTCYYQSDLQTATWSEAKSSCEQFGAQLTSVLSRQEILFISTLLSESYKYWIDLEQVDNVLSWVDGSNLSYTNLEESPEDSAGCFHISLPELLEKSDCGDQHAYICKKSLYPCSDSCFNGWCAGNDCICNIGYQGPKCENVSESVTHPGILTSRNYPDTYHHDNNYTQLIIAPRGQVMTISVLDLNLRATGCYGDFLQVTEISNSTATSLAVWRPCDLPVAAVSSNSNTVQLAFSGLELHDDVLPRGYKLFVAFCDHNGTATCGKHHIGRTMNDVDHSGTVKNGTNHISGMNHTGGMNYTGGMKDTGGMNDTDCRNFNCSVHGKCVEDDGNYYCHCDDGWRAKQCELGPISVVSDAPKHLSYPIMVSVFGSASVASLSMQLFLGNGSMNKYTLEPLANHSFMLNASFNFAAIGRYVITASVDGFDFPIMADTVVDVCDNPTITITGGGATRKNAMQIYRWQGLTLRGDVETSCLQVTSVVMKWTVFSIAYGRDSYQLKLSTATDLDNLVLNPYSLDYGFYWCKLQVQVDTDEITFIDSSETWIEVIQSPLQPLLVGGASKSIGALSDVYLDGSQSYDPDLPADSATSNMLYAWFCSPSWDSQRIPVDYDDYSYFFTEGYAPEVLEGCFRGAGVQLPNTTSKMTFAASSLDWSSVPASFIFRLFASKPGRSAVYTDQRISIVPGNPPNIEVACFWNCNPYLNPNERLAIKSTCTNCIEGEWLSYLWTVHVGSPTNPIQDLDWTRDTLTGKDSYNLVINAGVFSSNRQELYELGVTVTRTDGTLGLASYAFMTNAAPSIGQCSVFPTDGIVLETVFSVNCTGFTDPDQPLMYKIQTRVGPSDLGSLIHEGHEHIIHDLSLPLGDPDDDFRVTIIITVLDAFSASCQVTTTVKVREPAVIEIADLVMLTSGDSSPLSEMIISGDRQAATQLISSVSSVLNTQTNSETSSERTQIRESLVESLVKVKIQTLGSLQHSTTVMNQLTSVPQELTDTTKTTAADAIEVMSGLLIQHSVQGASTEEVKLTGLLLLSSVSNIMDSLVSTETNVAQIEQSQIESKTRNVSLASLAAIDGIKSALLASKVAGEQPTVIHTDSIVVQLSKDTPLGIQGAHIFTQYESAAQISDIYLPQTISIAPTVAEIGTEIVQFEQNPYTWSSTSEHIKSNVVELVLKDDTSNEIAMTNLTQPINMFIPYSGVTDQGTAYISLSKDSIGFVELNISPSDPDIYMLMYRDTAPDTEMAEDSQEAPYVLLKLFYIMENATDIMNGTGQVNDTEFTYMESDQLPGYDDTTDDDQKLAQVLLTTQIPLSDPLTMALPWSHGIVADDLRSDGVYIVQTQLVNTQVGVNLSLVILQTTCYYWDKGEDMWNTEGCSVGGYLTLTHLHCMCTHLTSFGGGFFVMPNTINLVENITKFTTFWENPVGIAMISFVMGIYLISILIARRKDHLCKLKALPIDLFDNDPDNKCVYLLTVYTGSRLRSGTSSVITVVLNGTSSSSSPHVLESTGFPVLQRGDINFFLIRTAKSLGMIKSLRFWHHNTGNDPAWFLSRAVVLDIHTNQEYFFPCKCWLAIDIGNCVLDKTINVATKKEVVKFNNLFNINASSGFGNDHIWFSALNRHVHSTVTCVQRISCCLCILMSYMLSNLIFYGIEPDPAEQAMEFGPISITMTELAIGLESAMLTFPVNFLIVTLFKKARPRHSIQKTWKNTRELAWKRVHPELHPGKKMWRLPSKTIVKDTKDVQNNDCETKVHFADVNKVIKATLKGVGSKNVKDTAVHKSSTAEDAMKLETKSEEVKDEIVPADVASSKDVKCSSLQDVIIEDTSTCILNDVAIVRNNEPFMLCWWSVYIAWFLVAAVTFVCGFFTILYMFDYGLTLSIQWVKSLLVSWVCDMLVQQPLQVIGIALFISLIIRKPSYDKHVNTKVLITTTTCDEDLTETDSFASIKKWLSLDSSYVPPRLSLRVQALIQKKLDRRVNAVGVEIIRYTVYLFLVLLITYAQQDDNIFYQNKNIEDMLIKTDSYNEVGSLDDFLEWLNSTFVESLFYELDEHFIANGVSYKLGPPRIIQVRMDKERHCSIYPPELALPCVWKHSYKTEDKADYQGIWTHNATGYVGEYADFWNYQNYSEAGGAKLRGLYSVYMGGGYIAELGSTRQEAHKVLDYIHLRSWFDSDTVAVIAELSVYSANTNLLSLMVIGFEISNIGSVNTLYELHTIKMYSSHNTMYYILFVLRGIYCLNTLYFIIYESRKIYRYRMLYFRNPWNIFELGALLSSILVISLYAANSIETDRAIRIFNTVGPKQQIFYYVLLLDRTLKYMVAFIVTCGMLKYIHLLRYFPMIHEFGCVIRSAAMALMSVALLWFMLFLAYSLFIILLAGSHMEMFKDLPTSLMSLICGVLGEVEIDELSSMHHFWGPMLYFCLMFASKIILFNMMTIVMCLAHREIKLQPQPLEDAFLLKLLMEKIKRWFNLSSPPSYLPQSAHPKHSVTKHQSQKRKTSNSKTRKINNCA